MSLVVSERAQKLLRRIPGCIRDKLAAWARLVEQKGLPEARKIPGFHADPLRGKRQGQRSVGLNRAYRAIYVTAETGELEIVSVEEVMKHDY